MYRLLMLSFCRLKFNRLYFLSQRRLFIYYLDSDRRFKVTHFVSFPSLVPIPSNLDSNNYFPELLEYSHSTDDAVASYD